MSGSTSGWFSLLARIFCRGPQRRISSLLRLELTIRYLKAIRAARLGVIAFLAVLLCIGLLLAGFVLLHLGLVCFFDTPRQQGWFLVICGGVYFVLALAALLAVTSQRTWMRGTGAGDLVRRALEEQRKP